MTLFGKFVASIFIVSIVLGGFLYVRSKNAVPEIANLPEQQTIQESTTTETSSTTPAPTGKKMAFSVFLEQETGSYKCDVNQVVENIDSQGVVYLRSGMIRGEFTSTVGGQSITSTMITKGGYTYTWTSVMPTSGFKIKAQSQVSSASSSVQGSYSWNAEQIGDYTCEKQEVLESKFILPQSVTFTEIN